MTGIFGCISFSTDVKQFEDVIITSLDKRRGKKYEVYVDSRAILGVQYGDSTSNIHFLKKNDLVVTLLSSAFRETVTIDKSVFSNEMLDLDEYSAAAYDKKSQRFLLVNDVFNIRKVYYLKKNDVLFYSSSLRHLINFLKKVSNRSFPLSIDMESLIFYLVSGSFPPGSTLFSEIQKTLPGERLYFNSNGITRIGRLLNVHDMHLISDERTAEDLIFNTLLNSVSKRANYDENIAISLSGGIDSSLILALLTKIYPRENIVGVHISLDARESQNAESIADFAGIKLIEKKLSSSEPNRLHEIVTECLHLMDEPTTRSGFVPRFVALKEIAQVSKVAFLGEGGDELFLGYVPELWIWDEKTYVKPIINTYLTKISLALFSRFGDLGINKLRVLPSCTYSDSIRRYALSATILDLRTFFTIQSYIKLNVSELILRKLDPIVREAENLSFSKETLSSRSYLLLYMLPYSDILVDENFSSYLNVGLKLPFFDQNVARLAFSLSRELKLKNGTTRYIIRQMAEHKKLIPTEIIKSRKKIGFMQPVFNHEEYEIKDKLKNLPLENHIISLLGRVSELPKAADSVLILLDYFESLKLY
jgi:asparagine synthase (glutamine-hydrolysing)